MQSETIGELAKALAATQAKITPPTKGRVGKVKGTTKEGKFYEYEYHYADLAEVIQSYRAPLAENGLALVQATRTQDGHIVLVTSLLHTSGEWLSSEYPVTLCAKPQEQGSALTYARRYAVTALLGIAAEDDDDGAAAQAGTPKAAEKRSVPPSPPLASSPGDGPVKASVISRPEQEAMHALAKDKGMTTVTAFREYLKGLTGNEQAKDLSRTEYVSVMDALKAMREKVPA